MAITLNDCSRNYRPLKNAPISVKGMHFIFATISLYFSISEGMDECDTAALLFECGKKNAPGLMAHAISTIGVNASFVRSIIKLN